MSIVLIDSNQSEVETICKVLRQGGYSEIVVAKDLDEANDKIGIGTRATTVAVFGIDLIIVAAIGDIDGLDNVRRVRESFQHQDVPMIVVGDKASPDMIQMAFAFGASDYSAIPLREYEFLCRVRSLMRLKHEIDRRKARERELIEVTRQLSDLNNLLTRLALIDSLTGIANRRCFDRSLEQEWNRGFRNMNPLSLIMIDVDFFKSYNDAYGHQAGDDALKEVVKGIAECLRRPADLVCRYGGEEMAILLPDTPMQGAQHVADRVKAKLESFRIPHCQSKVSPFVTLSQGLATVVPSKDTTSKQLVAAADRALYMAKHDGRNCIKTLDVNDPSLLKALQVSA